MSLASASVAPRPMNTSPATVVRAWNMLPLPAEGGSVDREAEGSRRRSSDSGLSSPSGPPSPEGPTAEAARAEEGILGGGVEGGRRWLLLAAEMGVRVSEGGGRGDIFGATS